MAVHAQNHLTIRHIDRLPRPLVRGLTAAVLLIHSIVIAIALKNVPLVELGGSAGGGNGGGNGALNKTLLVSVLPGDPYPSAMSVERKMIRSTEKPVSAKNKAQQEIIATTAATQKMLPENSSIQQSLAERTSTTAADSKTITDPPVSSAPSRHSLADSNASGNAGTGNGTESGYGDAKGTGAGQGEGAGNGIGSAGNGNGVARPVSLSLLRYKRAVKPEYPARSIQKHESGQVNVRVVVDTVGRVHDARVVLSSGFRRLDEAALKAARHSTFHPYTEHGRPLFAMAIIPYRFNLSNQ